MAASKPPSAYWPAYEGVREANGAAERPADAEAPSIQDDTSMSEDDSPVIEIDSSSEEEDGSPGADDDSPKGGEEGVLQGDWRTAVAPAAGLKIKGRKFVPQTLLAALGLSHLSLAVPSSELRNPSKKPADPLEDVASEPQKPGSSTQDSKSAKDGKKASASKAEKGKPPKKPGQAEATRPQGQSLSLLSLQNFVCPSTDLIPTLKGLCYV